MIFLADAENRTIVSSFVWTKHRNVTDGRTDRHTESLWLLRAVKRHTRTVTHKVLLHQCW